MTADPGLGPLLRVDVVPDLWIDGLLPLAAIVISIGTLVWTVFDRRKDATRVLVKTAVSVLIHSTGRSGPFITVTATNISRSAHTVLESIVFEREDGTGFYMEPPAAAPRFTAGPLGPGETATLFVDPTSLAQACRDAEVDPKDLRPVAVTGHKKFHGELTPAVQSALEA